MLRSGVAQRWLEVWRNGSTDVEATVCSPMDGAFSEESSARECSSLPSPTPWSRSGGVRCLVVGCAEAVTVGCPVVKQAMLMFDWKSYHVLGNHKHGVTIGIFLTGYVLVG